jgi:putative protease
LYWESELKKVSHRSYSNASLVEAAGADSIFNERENTETEWQMAGTVIEASPQSGIVIEVRNAFNQGDELEILPFTGPAILVHANEITDIMLKPVLRTRPSTLIKLPYQLGVMSLHLVRQKVKA